MSSGTTSPPHLFENLWRQLGECHQNERKELEAKVNKLKKDRCLDAQRLEVFYNRNQQLKEQNTTLQDAISELEERLRTGECDRCTLLKETLKSSQDQNLQVITKLKNERNALENENRKLLAELQKSQCSNGSSEQEDGIIPDSPILSSSLSKGSKLRKHKNTDKKNIRYVEKPLPWSNKSLFNAQFSLMECPPPANDVFAEVLALNTCEEDASQISKDVDEVIAETCAFELHAQHAVKKEETSSHLNPSASGQTSTLIHSPDSTSKRSPSLLPVVSRTARRNKQEIKAEPIQEVADSQTEGGRMQPEQNRKSPVFGSNGREPLHDEEEPGQFETSSQLTSASPVFKKPNGTFRKGAEGAERKRSLQETLPVSHGQPPAKQAGTRRSVEPVWSVDTALPVCHSERMDEEEEEEEEEEELIDTDVTWVSHSLLQGRGSRFSKLGQKAHDSMEMMFDKTVDEEYKSFIGESQPCDDDDDDDEEEMKEENHDQDRPEKSKAQVLPFPHIAVVRRKEERRKLKGTTCKECEIYYSYLPEGEKQKKLAACSRHRFHYIPPCTPENFWEVGFPSTQTCVERGYIREEKNPQERLRRRRPFSALFSPKKSQKHI